MKQSSAVIGDRKKGAHRSSKSGWDKARPSLTRVKIKGFGAQKRGTTQNTGRAAIGAPARNLKIHTSLRLFSLRKRYDTCVPPATTVVSAGRGVALTKERRTPTYLTPSTNRAEATPKSAS